MDGRPTRLQGIEPLRAMLLAALSLEACAAAQEARNDSARSTARSTKRCAPGMRRSTV